MLFADLAFFQEFFSRGEFIVMQISFVMLFFLLFSDQISGGAKVSEGKTASGAAPLPPVEESQLIDSIPNYRYHILPELIICITSTCLVLLEISQAAFYPMSNERKH